MKKNRVEILAPAGSMESLQASFKAGADAAYMGGTRFGARAYAENPGDEQLLYAIDYAHMRGKRLYLTLNTLIKENELDEVVRFLTPLYREGLDAVIVQDLGVINLCREFFKELPIHISTQMSISSPDEAALFDEQVTRIVPARELCLGEIAELKKKSKKEIEVFVHGALCYCYSGQCLLSSSGGDRSGNRGRCAQPCRRQYVYDGRERYWLSPKDICTIDHIPELIKAGVDSFKIEGRMKQPEYACGTAELYKAAVSLYEELGEEDYEKYVSSHKKELEDGRISLLDLFNRGGFCAGYAFMRPGPDMMALERPNHSGVYVGSAKVIKGYARLVPETDVFKGDVLEIRDNSHTDWYSYTLPENVKRGRGELKFKAYAGRARDENGRVEVYRIRREELLKRLRRDHIEEKDRIALRGCLRMVPGEVMSIEISTTDPNEAAGRNFKIRAEGDVVMEAKNAPLDEADIREKLLRSGDSDFYFEDLNVVTEGRVFVPKSRLGEIRRKAFSLLYDQILQHFKRSTVNDCIKETVKSLPSEKRSTDARVVGLNEYDRFKERLLHIANHRAAAELESMGMGEAVLSHELDRAELAELTVAVRSQSRIRLVLDVYGREHLMISKQCIKRNAGNCNRKKEFFRLKSYDGRELLVYSDCEKCRNLILNDQITDLRGEIEGLREIAPDVIRAVADDEPGRAELEKSLRELCEALDGDQKEPDMRTAGEVYTGHFYRKIL